MKKSRSSSTTRSRTSEQKVSSKNTEHDRTETAEHAGRKRQIKKDVKGQNVTDKPLKPRHKTSENTQAEVNSTKPSRRKEQPLENTNVASSTKESTKTPYNHTSNTTKSRKTRPNGDETSDHSKKSGAKASSSNKPETAEQTNRKEKSRKEQEKSRKEQGKSRKEQGKSREEQITEQHKSTFSNEINNTTASAAIPSEPDEDYEYNDDFEEYDDDDFEVDESSSTSEISDSSVDQDLTPQTEQTAKGESQLPIQEKELQTSKTQKVHTQISTKQDHRLLDEGFKVPTSPILSFAALPTQDQMETSSTYTKGFNFASASKQHRQRRSAQQRYTRGVTLLSLIQLQQQKIDLMEIEPASYKQITTSFMKAGQVIKATQTRDDDLNEESQTNHIELVTKWTQYPIAFNSKVITNADGDVLSAPTTADYRGVGSDGLAETDKPTQFIADSTRFTKFISSASRCMLMLLEETNVKHADQTAHRPSDVSFSTSATYLKTDTIPTLQGYTVSYLEFSARDPDTLLSAHIPGSKTGERTSESSKGVVCIWSLERPSQPQHIVTVPGEPSTCCFVSPNSSTVAMGCSDGSLHICNFMEQNWHSSDAIRTPSYTTAHLSLSDSHQSRIMSLKTLPTIKETVHEINVYEDTRSLHELCSLDNTGHLMFWAVSVVHESERLSALDDDLGQAPWARTKLVKLGHICVHDSLEPTQRDPLAGANAFCFHPADPSHIYVAMDDGAIVHCSRQGGGATPRIFRLAETAGSAVRCLQSCPWQQQPALMLSGGAGGVIGLHDLRHERATISWSGDTDAGLVALLWSKHRPAVLFAMLADSTVHVWDFNRADMAPVETIQLPNSTSTALDASYSTVDDRQVTKLAFFTQRNGIEVHTLTDQYNSKTPLHFQQELDKFLHYIQ